MCHSVLHSLWLLQALNTPLHLACASGLLECVEVVRHNDRCQICYNTHDVLSIVVGGKRCSVICYQCHPADPM